MRLLTLLGVLIAPALAIFQDEAFRTDFHYALLGAPVPDRTFFHQPDPSSKATLLYTLSEQGVLGAVLPRDGSVVWRQLLGTGSRQGAVKAAGEAVIAGVGREVTAWSAVDGKLVWREVFDGVVAPRGIAVVDGDAVVAVGGEDAGVRRLDGLSGTAKWTFADSSKDEPLGMSVVDGKVFYVSLQKAMLKGFKIKVTTLDAETGKQSDSYTLSSDSDIYDADDVVYLGSEGDAPVVVWTDKTKQTLKVNVLGNKQENQFPTKRGDEQAETVAIRSAAVSKSKVALLAHYHGALNNWADVYDVNVAKGKLSKAHEHRADIGKGAFASHAIGSDIFFTRVSLTGGFLFSSASKSAFRSWDLPTSLISTSGSTDRDVGPISATTEVVPRPDSSYAVRTALLLSNGDWVMTRGDETDWVRHEGLASTVVAQWAEYREETPLVEELKVEEHSDPVSAFAHRIRRHVEALQSAPSFLQHVPVRVTEWLQSFTQKDTTALTKRDTFGINKVIIAATAGGRAITLDPAQRGKVISNLQILDVPKGQLLNETSAQEIFDRFSTKTEKQSLIFPGLFSSIKSETGSDTLFGLQDGKLRGYQGQKAVWHYSPLPGERIVSVVTQYPSEPVAAIGKVLGDRNVLYKYINPNSIVLTTVDDDKHTASVTLLDTVSGSVIHSIRLSDVDTSKPLPAVVSENWFAFFYATDNRDDALSKGYQVVMSELYESDIPNDRGPLGAAANYSSAEPKLGRLETSKPYIISQVFHVPEEVSHLAVTQTGQGITTRHLLATLARSNSIVSIPRAALDPRRIVGKDPTSAQAEEGLSRYSPFLNFESQWILNHKQELLGVKAVTTTPSLLESTSLVFAYGLDVFGTRVAPSFAFDVLGDDFNKIQLMFTVVALTAATFIVAPLIERKQVNMLWQNV